MAIGAMISSTSIEPGEKLPPIRQVAAALGVSSSTVADAWTILRTHQMIDTDRRRGTTVRHTAHNNPKRYWRVPMPTGTLALDLSTGTPDPQLLPRLEPILERINSGLELTSYLDPPVLGPLEDALRERWPYDAPSIAVVDGANDGLDRIIRSTVKLGDRVIVEDPTYPLLLDLLELAGALVIGVPLDEEGPRLDALTDAMQHTPTAMIIQTSAHNPTGISLTPKRAAAIADLLAPTSTILIEDDHAAASVDHPVVSLGSKLPDRVFRIHSFSKTYGPDLRIAALSGPAAAIKDINERRQLGPGWTSRLLQRILLEMLRSREVDAAIANAASVYQDRRDKLANELDARGITINAGSGLNMWVPVEREQLATVALAAQGIGVAPGEPFRVATTDEHLRVTTAYLREGFDDIATKIVAAASITGSR